MFAHRAVALAAALALAAPAAPAVSTAREAYGGPALRPQQDLLHISSNERDTATAATAETAASLWAEPAAALPRNEGSPHAVMNKRAATVEPAATTLTVDTTETAVTAATAAPAAAVPVNERFPHAVLFGGSCGGSILSATWVLTAAHCTIFTNGHFVLAGTNHTRRGGVVRHVKRLVVHPLFTVGPYWLNPADFGIKQVGAHWDFLLAELTEPLPLDGTRIRAVALDDQAEVPPGLSVGYAGYGAAGHGGAMRRDMHAMQLETLTGAACADLPEFDARDMLCARGVPPRLDSACNGDSGSGLVAGGRLLGVASWVEDDATTCHRGARVVFSRVAAARDWIRQVTKL